MARILKGRFGFHINLDGNVGPRGGNERTDVGAVQYALLLLSAGASGPFPSRGSLVVPGQGTIAVDGFFGPQTAAFINAYQATRVRSPGPSSGALPQPDGNFGNFRSTSWNYGLLETDVSSAAGKILELMPTDPRCPSFLKQAFIE
jgi:hypothetical protein